MLKKILIASTIFTGVAYGSTYYVVAPLKSAQQVEQDQLSFDLDLSPLPPLTVGVPYSYDLTQRVRVVYAYNLDTAVLLSLTQASTGLELSDTGVLTALLTQADEIFISLKASYSSKSKEAQLSIPVAYPSSCKQLLELNPGANSGWHYLDGDGMGPESPQQYYCDMTSAGGGWTRVVNQLEQFPVNNWNGGFNGAAYALVQTQIPEHTQIGFGSDDNAITVDYINMQYTTGDIAKTTVVGLKTGRQYHVHRSSTMYYGSHDPELGIFSAEWNNTLTLDQVGSTGYNWSFGPNRSSAYSQERGYGLNGVRHNQADTQSWSIWVR